MHAHARACCVIKGVYREVYALGVIQSIYIISNYECMYYTVYVHIIQSMLLYAHQQQAVPNNHLELIFERLRHTFACSSFLPW